MGVRLPPLIRALALAALLAGTSAVANAAPSAATRGGACMSVPPVPGYRCIESRSSVLIGAVARAAVASEPGSAGGAAAPSPRVEVIREPSPAALLASGALVLVAFALRGRR